MDDGLDGYYIGFGNSGDSMSNEGVSLEYMTGYTDSTYFQDKGYYWSNNYDVKGYLLASPCAYGGYYLMCVNYYEGWVRNEGGGHYYGIRPAVYLPYNTSLWQDENGIWQAGI